MTPETAGPDGRQIARKTVHGIFWSYASFGLGKALVFLTTAILARLLTPNDFGIVAFATLTTEYLAVLKDLGLGAALIQRRQDVEEAANTVFTLNLLLGAGLTLAGMLAAPLVATFFREPLVTPILRWLSLTFIVNALGSVHVVRLQRELEFGRKLIPDLGRSVAKGIVSIGCALTGFGVRSLVFGQLVGVVVGVILAWVVFPWRPRLTINTNLASRLLKYGLSLMSLDAITAIGDNFDYLIIGRLFGNVPLGIYTLAYRLPELLGLNMLWVMAGALFPAYSSIQHQPDVLRRGFLTTLRFIEMLSVPICLGLILTADPLIRVAFGDQWLDAIPIVRVLAAYVLVVSTGFNVGDIYKAVGRPDILVKLGVLNLALLLPALWYGSHFGLIGVAFGHLAVSTCLTVICLTVATRFIKVTWGDILLQLKPSFLSGGALVLLVLPSLYLTAEAAPLLRLVVAACAGAVSYLGILWLLEHELLRQAGGVIGLPRLGLKSSSLSSTSTSSPDVEPAK